MKVINVFDYDDHVGCLVANTQEEAEEVANTVISTVNDLYEDSEGITIEISDVDTLDSVLDYYKEEAE